MKTILVSCSVSGEEFEGFEELSLLARTADYEVVGTLTQSRGIPDKTYYIGKGRKN
jgi:50S ribosomal subunit-associated GTPase HflX